MSENMEGRPWEALMGQQWLPWEQSPAVPEGPWEGSLSSTWTGRLTAALCSSEWTLFLQCTWHNQTSVCQPSSLQLQPWARLFLEGCLQPRRVGLFLWELVPAPGDGFVTHAWKVLLSRAGPELKQETVLTGPSL